MPKWKKTRFPGVRYREHETRKHGIGPDRYFAIRYQRDGKRKEEGMGWSTESWTAEKAAHELHALKKSYTTGEGPIRLAEKRKMAEKERILTEKKKIQAEKDSKTFKHFFEKKYWPVAMADKKSSSLHTERAYFKSWIDPVIGEIPFRDIAPIHIEKIKRNLQKAKKAPRTIEYVFAVIRQVWNMARRDGFIDVPSPTKTVKRPKIDNKRNRFLTHSEAEALLSEVRERSEQLYLICLISLQCGLRASEIFRLKWQDVDIDRKIISVIGKGEKSRPAFMTDQVQTIFKSLNEGKPGEWVFPDRNGKQIKRVSNAFHRAVKELGLNDGIIDSRQKVVFHTLRHTYASWLVENGTDLYTVRKLMGHSTLAMTERYAHLSEGTLQNAVKKLEIKIKQSKRDNVVKMDKER